MIYLGSMHQPDEMRIIIGAGGAVPVTWTVDATSGKAYPASAAEWADFRAAYSLAMPAPTSIYTFQGAGPGIVDENGMYNLVQDGTAPTYGVAVAGHTRVGVQFVEAGHELRNLSIPNMNANSGMLMIFGIITAPAGTRGIIGLPSAAGGGGLNALSLGPKWRCRVPGSLVESVGGYSASVEPYGFWKSYADAFNFGFNGTERVDPANATLSNGTHLRIGNAGEIASAPMKVTYALFWQGAAAEAAAGATPANLKACLSAMGMPNTWSA